MTFMELFRKGLLLNPIETFNNEVSKWHDEDTNTNLPEFLGMTEQEYTNVIENPSLLVNDSASWS